MKKILLITLPVLASVYSFAQTNTFPSNGNAGIGTLTPQARLEVQGADTNPLTAGVQITSPVFPQLLFNASMGTANAKVWRIIGRGSNDFEIQTLGDNYQGEITAMQINRGGTSISNVLFPNGNIGIGIPNPSVKLEVNGDGKFSSNLAVQSININGSSLSSNTSQSNINVFSGNGIHINGSLANIAQDAVTYTSGGGGGAAISFGRGGSYDTFLAFYTNGGANHADGGISEAMRITQAQYVGIGTSTPDAKLTVAGLIHAGEVKIDHAALAVPDYVFDKDYNLATLKDVKTYIDENHHLPEIPSAQELAKNGVNLGEMNMRLLKKIEELTLYLIEENKKNQKQEQQISELSDQLTKLTNQKQFK